MGFQRSIRPLGLDLLEDPDTYYIETDDFNGYLEAGWNGAANGAGATQAVSTYGVDFIENAFGVYQVQSGTSSTGMASIYKNPMLLGRNSIVEKWRFALENLGTAGEDYTARVGMFDECNTTSAPNNGVFFRYQYNVNGGNWQCVARSNGGAEVVANSSIPATVTFQQLTIRIDESGGRAEFFIDGASAGILTSGIPISGPYVYPCMKIQKSAGNTNRNLHVDWRTIKITRVGAR